MLDPVKMKESCRICARELCGNQRRWIFHPAAKVNLQILLSHALGQDLTRDGRGEFACSKCAFMLDRMYRFDTVIARVEALSLERLHKLLLEKDRLRQCIGGLYQKNNAEEENAVPPGSCGTELGSEESPVVDLSALPDVRYSDLIQDDLTYSVYESWADKDDPVLDHHSCHHHPFQSPDPSSAQRPRRCRGCTALRVADSDYEAVCKVPRRVGRRSTSCGPSTRYSTAAPGEEDPAEDSRASEPTSTFDTQKTTCDGTSLSPGLSVESLETTVDLSCPPVHHIEREEPEEDPEEVPARGDPPWERHRNESPPPGPDMLLSHMRVWGYRPVKTQRGSKLPVRVKAERYQGLTFPVPLRLHCGGTADCELYPQQTLPEVVTPCLQQELAEMEEQWLDDYVQFSPVHLQNLDQRLVDEQRGPLTRYKGTAGQCVAELQRTQDQKLQQRLREMELQLKSAQEDARRQERTIQNITDVVNSKEEQVLDLRQLVEEQKKMLFSLRELANSSQIQASSVDGICGQKEVMVLQASLFQAQLELQASERVQLQAIRNQDDLRRALQRLETDLLRALQHRKEAERHNKDLQAALEKTQAALQEREEQLTEGERDRQRRQDETEETIMELKACLLTKEQLIKDCELLEDPEKKRNSVLEKLRQRIKERDRALERAVDEKFHCVEEKEAETRRLQLLLREKERDIETQRRVLDNNQETITSLEVLLRGKVLELEQVRDAWRNIQRQQQDSEEGQSHALRERDAIISHLQGALHASTQEAQDGFSSLLARIQSAPSKVLEDLKVRLQLKDRLLQEVLADRTCQAKQHQEQVQDLLRTISSRDQYIQESASRLGEVMAEQTARLQELRRQLSSGAGSKSDSGSDLELQAVQEELRLALRRERENQELSRSQAIRVDLLSRELLLKEETIRDLQRNMVDPSGPPLVEQLTQEVQELRESLIQLGGPPARGPILGQDRHESGEPREEGGDEADEDVDRLRVRAEVRSKGLIEVRQLVEQKKVVERQLAELKVQLQKAGFSSLSQMRKALFSLGAENGELKHQMTEEEEEEEEDVTIEGVEKDEEEELWETWDDELHHPSSSTQVGGVSKQRGPVLVRSEEQQGSLMVSEARVRVRKDNGVLLPETAVQQDSKQVQVDLQDPGYETCGRSENEAEREDTSSPEFDDLEMCTALDCGSQWWPASSTGTSTSTGTTFTRTTSQSTALEKESSLQRLVEDLRSQLSRSQAVIRGLQNRLRSLSTSSDYGPSAPRKVNWSFQASPAQSGTEDDEGWQSSDGGLKASARHRHSEPGLQELVSRVDALEEQLRNGGTKTVVQDGKAASWPGRFDSLIQAQARELSHLRQRLKESRGFCSILSQQLVDTTKTFEELLRSNDVDYYMGQNFREQLAQSSALAQRLATKISIRDQPEDPEEKTELLAIRLGKELQQKDQIIESLRAKLNQHHHHRSDTPTSSHAFSDATDQSDRISYVSDERGSTNDDLEAGSDVDTTSENAQKETSSSVSAECLSFGGAGSCHSSVTPSISSSHTAQSWLSFPNMHCSSSPHTRADVRRQTGRQTAPASSPAHPQSSFNPREPPPTTLTTCYQDDRGVGFSLADVHQELQMLQRQLGDAEKFSSTRSGPQGVPDPLTLHGLQPFPLSSSTLKSGASLLEGSALWDMAYGRGPVRLGADLSSGSSGYHTGPSHTGSDLMREHLGEIRSLRQRLEDSIQTNERLRLQLEDRLARTTCEKGAPTNIYIQGLDSVGRVSTDIRLLKEENLSLQYQLKDTTRDGAKEAERLREEALLQRARLTEAVLEAERWAEQSSKMQTEAEARSQEIVHLKKDRQKNKDTVNRVQHEVMVLQQQLAESHRQVQGLQEELQVFHREQGVTPESGRLPVRNLISPHGLHAVAYIDDLTALRQQVQEGGAVLTEMEENLGSEPSDLRLHVKLLSDAETLRRVLDQVRSLLLRFWIEAPPTGKETKQETSLQEEVFSLHLRLSEQDRALKDAMERVESSNRSKDSMERFIVSQLSRTRDVLRRAKTNLQVKNLEDSGSTPSLMVRVS